MTPKGSSLNRKATCHPERKHFSKGMCLECYRKDYDRKRYESNKEGTKSRTALYKKENPDKVAVWGKKYRTENKEKESVRHKIYNYINKTKVSESFKRRYMQNKEKQSERHKKYYKENPEIHRRKRLKKCGLSLEDYENMFNSQSGLCAICGRDNKGKSLHVDHDHGTGSVRQLLCNACNVGLGSFGDNIEVMEKAIEYLRKHKK